MLLAEAEFAPAEAQQSPEQHSGRLSSRRSRLADAIDRAVARMVLAPPPLSCAERFPSPPASLAGRFWLAVRHLKSMSAMGASVLTSVLPSIAAAEVEEVEGDPILPLRMPLANLCGVQ
jgi:hypothetical protein